MQIKWFDFESGYTVYKVYMIKENRNLFGQAL